MTKHELIEAAFDHPYRTPGDLAVALAKERALVDGGVSLTDVVDDARPGVLPDLGLVIGRAFVRACNEADSDQAADGIEASYRSRLRASRRASVVVRDAGVPLTLRNALRAYADVVRSDDK